MTDRPIGVFDSGVGGLTVVKEIIKILPEEDIIYFGDTARVPYGNKSKETVTRFSVENTSFLIERGVKFVVVACNTSSSLALNTLMKRFKIPILGVLRPGAEEASRVTENKRVGIIGTEATIRSRAYSREIKKHNSGVRVLELSCPLFVPLVEEGWIKKEAAKIIAEEYLAPFKRTKIDTLILGCTHYPLLKPMIKKVLGENIRLIDSARETAKRVKRMLEEKKLLSCRNRPGKLKFYVNDEPRRFAKVGQKFLTRRLKYIRCIRDVRG